MLEATTRSVPEFSRRPRTVIVLWLIVAGTIAISGVIGRVPQLAPAFLFSTLLSATVAYRRVPWMREWFTSLSTRGLLAFHIMRLPIGALFMWEHSRGQLPELFAMRAGVGDMIVGALAIAVTIGWQHRKAVVAFSLFGLADILLALGTAMCLLFGVQDPVFQSAIARLPYPLLPLAIVPAVIFSHGLVLFTRREQT